MDIEDSDNKSNENIPQEIKDQSSNQIFIQLQSEVYEKLRKSVLLYQNNSNMLKKLREASVQYKFDCLTKMIDEFIDKLLEQELFEVVEIKNNNKLNKSEQEQKQPKSSENKEKDIDNEQQNKQQQQQQQQQQNEIIDMETEKSSENNSQSKPEQNQQLQQQQKQILIDDKEEELEENTQKIQKKSPEKRKRQNSTSKEKQNSINKSNQSKEQQRKELEIRLNKELLLNRIELIFVKAKKSIEQMQQTEARQQLRKFEELIELNQLQVKDFSESRVSRYEQIKQNQTSKQYKQFIMLLEHQDQYRLEIKKYLYQINNSMKELKIYQDFIENMHINQIYSLLRRMILENQLDLYDLMMSCQSIKLEQYNLSIKKHVKIDQIIYFSIFKNRVLGRNSMQANQGVIVPIKGKQIKFYQNFRNNFQLVFQKQFPIIQKNSNSSDSSSNTQESNSDQNSNEEIIKSNTVVIN